MGGIAATSDKAQRVAPSGPASSADSIAPSPARANPEATPPRADAAKPEAPAERERLGTAHGDLERSSIRWVSFRRARSTPDEIVTIHYDRPENLIAMGIVARPVPPLAADPFPDAHRYVPTRPRGADPKRMDRADGPDRGRVDRTRREPDARVRRWRRRGVCTPLRSHERPVHRFFLRQGASPAVADDLLQDTWLAVVRNASTYAVDAKFTTWLYTVARSKLVDHWRAQRRLPVIDEAANDAGDDATDDALERIADSAISRPDVQAMSRQQARAFVAAVEALPGPQREAFLLHIDGDLSIAEMAEVAAVNAETMKSRVRYAMQKLRLACADWLEPRASTNAVATREAFDGAR